MRKNGHGMMRKKKFRQAAAFTVALLLLSSLLFTGWNQNNTIYAETPSKQSAIVIPIDFGQSLSDTGRPYKISFGGPAAAPQVGIVSNGKINGISLNDLYNGSHWPGVSVRQFLSKANYHTNFIVPFYMSSLSSGFAPFSLPDYDIGNLLKDGANGIDHLKMTNFLNTVVRTINANKPAANRLGTEIHRVYYGQVGEKEAIRTTINPESRIDHVVFLVNVSTITSYMTKELGLRSYHVGNTMDPRYKITEPFTAHIGEKNERLCTADIQDYEVIFIDDNLREALIHETMHVKGVKDLYLEPEPGVQEYPAGNWDVQSAYEHLSGPYFTQRRKLYSLQNQLTGAAVRKEADLQKEEPVSWDVEIKDINSAEAVNVVLDVTVHYPECERPENEWGGTDWQQHYWIEYRRPETDIYAKKQINKAKDGVLLFYTDFLEPYGGGIYLLKEMLLNGDKGADGIYPGSFARSVCVNSNVSRGFLRPADDERIAQGDSIQLDWTFSNIKTETVTVADASGRTKDEYRVSFKLGMQSPKITSGEVITEPVNW